jgi:hypothetical protein
MRITLEFDSVHVTDVPHVLDAIADTADLTVLHPTHPPAEDRSATIRRFGAESYTITKGPISREQATRILDGLQVYYTNLEDWKKEIRS